MEDVINRLAPTWFSLLKSAISKFSMDKPMDEYCNPIEYDAMVMYGFVSSITKNGICRCIDRGLYRFRFDRLVELHRLINTDTSLLVIDRYLAFIDRWALGVNSPHPMPYVKGSSFWMPSKKDNDQNILRDAAAFDALFTEHGFDERYVTDIENYLVGASVNQSSVPVTDGC